MAKFQIIRNVYIISMIPKKIILFLLITFHIQSLSSQLTELQTQITSLEMQNKIISSYRYPQQQYYEDHSRSSIQTQQSPQLILNPICNFTKANQYAHLFQTLTDIYFTLYLPQTNKTKIYNAQCQQISSFNNLTIKSILTDRGLIQSGIVYFISTQDHLYHLYEQSNFSYPLKIANLKTIHSIANGIVRYKGKQRIQIFIFYQNGIVKIFDETGTNKLTLELQGTNSQISMVVDRHPYPLFISKSNWLSILDTSKYQQIQQNCPYIPNILYILPQNPYGQSIFVLNHNNIYLINIQTTKKQCHIKKEYPLNTNLNHINQVSYYSNSLFIDNHCYNLTEKKLRQNNNNCLGYSFFEFITKKNQPNLNYCLKRCCKDQECTVKFAEVKKSAQDKNIFLWLTLSFIIVIFISLSFIKKSNVNTLQLAQPLQTPQSIDKHIYQLSKKHRQNNSKIKKK